MDAPDFESHLECPEDFDLLRSQRMIKLGSYDPCARIDDGVFFRATRSPAGPVTYRLAEVGSGISIQAWGPGAQWVGDHATRLAGLADEPHAFAPDHSTLARWHSDAPLYMPQSLVLFEQVFPTILQQLVTWREAMLAYRGLVHQLGEPAPGPGELWLAPDAKRLAATPYYVLSEHGVLKRRSDTVRLAAKMLGRIDASTMSPKQLAGRMMAVRGIGSWTTEGVIATVLGYPDAVIIGDAKLPNWVCWNLADEPRGDDKRMLDLLRPFKGHRWRVITLIRQHGKAPPKWGPRRGMQTRARILGR